MNMKDLANGFIRFSGRVAAISPALLLQEFMKSDLYSDVTEESLNGFPRFTLQPQLVDGNKMSVSLIFNNEKRIFLVNISKTVDQNDSWDSWSEQHELQRKKEHDRLLEKLIGNTSRKFSWGEITSDYDPRSGSSMITVRYF
jgi:hypothetical protein